MKLTRFMLWMGLWVVFTPGAFAATDSLESSNTAFYFSPRLRIALNVQSLIASRRAFTVGRATFTDPRTGSDDLYGGFSADFGYQALPSLPNLYLGAELSWGAASTVFKSSAVRLGFLPTALFRFPSEFRAFTPYIGLSVGVSYFSGEVGAGEYNELSFQALAKFGFDLGTKIAFHLEPNVGLLGDRFVFVPKMGVSAAL